MDTILMMFQSSAATFFNPMILLIVAAGTFLGLVFGALPGLSATMGIVIRFLSEL